MTNTLLLLQATIDAIQEAAMVLIHYSAHAQLLAMMRAKHAPSRSLAPRPPHSGAGMHESRDMNRKRRARREAIIKITIYTWLLAASLIFSRQSVSVGSTRGAVRRQEERPSSGYCW